MNRKGFTLIEMLVVLAITGILFAAVIAFAPRWWADTWLRKGAAGVQGALIEAKSAAAAAWSYNASQVVGVRFIPDPQWELKKLPDGTIDRTRPIAYARTAPLVRPRPYRVGYAAIHTDGYPAGFTPAYGRLVLEQSPTGPDGYRAEPTTWFWLIRIGDVVTVNGLPYTVCGPTLIPPGPDNPDGFVNWGWPGQIASPLDRGAGPMEWLYLCNQLDDDRDGVTDEGWNGLDDDLDGYTDEPDEWEVERWRTPPASGEPVAYEVMRRPVVEDQRSGGDVADKKLQPSPIVVDGLRSILPVNPLTGAVDVVFDDLGGVTLPSIYGRPASMPVAVNKLCFWLVARADVTEPPSPERSAKLVTLDLRSGMVRTTDGDPMDVAGTLAREEGR